MTGLPWQMSGLMVIRANNEIMPRLCPNRPGGSSFCFPALPLCRTLACRMQKETTLALLQQMLGPAAQFRDGQWEAIDLAANQRQRLLVVQRTGWGKSVVYFLAAKILRDAGAGPTLLISPLLSLMRNQILAAEKLGIRAAKPSTARTSRTGRRSKPPSRPTRWMC